jgi:NHLM bacteriocin system ABC transporter ATP-binding protein
VSEPRTVASNGRGADEAATRLDDGSSPLLVRAGEATVFLAVSDESGATGRRTPVVTIEAPALLAMTSAPSGWRWIVGAGLGGEVEEATLDSDEEIVREAAVRTAEALGELLQRASRPPAERVVRLERQPEAVPNGHVAVVETTAWVQPAAGVLVLGGAALPREGAPLPPRIPLVGELDAVARAAPIDEVPIPRLVGGIEWLFDVAADQVVSANARRQRLDAEQALVANERAHEAERRAVRLLAEELRARPEPVIEAAHPLVASATRVLAAKNLALRLPSGGLDAREGTAAVRALAAASGVYARRVTLAGRWWNGAADAVLGFRPDGSPVALLPSGERMTAVEPDGRRTRVDATVAGGLIDVGFVFSKPIVDGNVDTRTLARIALRGRQRAFARYVGWAAILAASGLAVPFASGVVFDQIVPNSDRARLWYLLAALILVALATLPLQLALTSSQTRFETSGALDVQRGIWGRVLLSPVTLVKRVGAGDLAMRLAALETARDPVEKAVLSVLPALLSGLLAGLVLFHYKASLAAIVLAISLVLLGIALLLARSAARAQEEVDAATGSVNGFLFQVLIAIPKLRVAGAESRAFLAWADRFRFAVGQRLIRAGARQILFASLIPTLGSLALFTGVALIGPSSIGVDVFVAFQTTYNLFVTGVVSALGAAGAVLPLRPALDRAVELTHEAPESSPERSSQGELRGAVGFAAVTFRYQPTMRPVLEEMTFRVEPGEMVAIAGPSGSGKSTIIRLLLGFEHPEQGSVLFDDQHLSSLDVAAVRRQLGVVLQHGELIPGTVHDNIAGVASLTESEAWALAEVVALADDIRAMPMGMATVVSLNGGAFSGGQRQRLVIARALAARPRILLLDEATSALDNVTQRVVTQNLAELGMTRIVVAHRLSTMVDADRILVVHGGRVVEEGTYEGLIARGGMFQRLAARQML